MENIIQYINLEYMPGGVIIYRITKTIELLYANKVAWTFFDCNSEEDFFTFSKRNVINLVLEEDREGLLHMVSAAKYNHIEKTHHIQYRVRTKDGRICRVNDYGRVVEIPEYGEVVVCFFSEVKDSLMFLEEAKDKLTNLLSKEQLLAFAQKVISRAEYTGNYQSIYFVYMNIRNFKFYNLQNGMQRGDLVLIDFAEILRTYAKDDILCRLHGDHFVMLSQAPHVMERVEKIQKEFKKRYSSVGLALKVGIYEAKSTKENPTVAIDLAKSACDSIRDRRQNLRVYDEALEKKMTMARYISQNLEVAMKNHYIKVYYHPIICVADESLCSVEGLASWIDPVYGLLSPKDFIPVLEADHKITKLDLYILREICREMQEEEKQIPVSFNLSRLDFVECDIFQEVDTIIQEYGISRNLIHIEITESIVMGNPIIVRQQMNKFRQAGYEIWMDDFGSGYSSLNVLKDYQFDMIKLDMNFLKTMNQKSKDIVTSVIDMAKKLGMHTLAEGVENEEQFNFLKEIGCEKAQGFLYGKPFSIQEMKNFQCKHKET